MWDFQNIGGVSVSSFIFYHRFKSFALFFIALRNTAYSTFLTVLTKNMGASQSLRYPPTLFLHRIGKHFSSLSRCPNCGFIILRSLWLPAHLSNQDFFFGPEEDWMPKLQGWWKGSGPQPGTERWGLLHSSQQEKLKSGKRGFGRRAGSGSVERFAPGGVIVLLWLLPPSPLAINAGVQLSLRIGSVLGDTHNCAHTHTAIWRILTSLPIQSSRSWARRPSPRLSNQSTPWPTPPTWLD